MTGDEDTFAPIDVTGPNLIAARAGNMVRHTAAIRTEAKTIRKTFAYPREFAGVAAVQVHAEDLAALIAYHLNQYPIVGHQQSRRIKDRQAIALGDFSQSVALEIVDPKMRRCLVIILGERPARSIAPRFHAEKNHASSVREKWSGLPGNLIRHFEVEVMQAGAVGIDQGGFALRGEKERGLAIRNSSAFVRPSASRTTRHRGADGTQCNETTSGKFCWHDGFVNRVHE